MAKIEHIAIEQKTHGVDFYDITDKVESVIKGRFKGDAIVLAYCMHTSASLCIQEAYDPSAKEDMKTFLEKLAPMHQDWHQHTLEGPDDTTSHLKSLLTGNQLYLPARDGHLIKGQWQGLYLCEHRSKPHTRKIIISLIASS